MRIEGAAAPWLYRKVLQHPLLPALLRELGTPAAPLHAGWGCKPSGLAARHGARRHGESRLLLLEDAFVRSLQPGAKGFCYGLIADSKGIHYADDGRSDLLDALESGTPSGWMRHDPLGAAEIRATMERFRGTGASKYNWFPGEYEDAPAKRKPGILVVDQARGDAAIRHGGIPHARFAEMLQAAFDECEGAPVYLRAHPDHLFRARKSCFPRHLLHDKRLHLLPPDLSPAQCFTFCRTVFAASSLMGMEALIHGCRVVVFGAPFYAGWGLTEDRAPVARGRRLPLEELFGHAYLRYCHYFDPDTGEPCGLDRILDHIALQKELFRRNRGTNIAIGLSPWKQRIAPAYLRSPAGRLHQLPFSGAQGTAADPSARLLLWGRKQEFPAGFHGRTARIEDGFLRSKGLGAAFHFPYSWVVDETGIYFDADATSDLERILEEGSGEADLAQARQLIALLLEKRLTKYNLAREELRLDPALVRGRKVILVPGQVEADASILFGSPELKTNLALLRRVREQEPQACIVFKAHPDLVAGARHGELLPAEYHEICDLAVTSGNILDWLDLCDEIHTMTSTVGFEALIRGKAVVTYGLPFYAGWGLTRDHLSCPRRTRRISVEELVCGALVRYPRYVNPATGEFTTALKVAELLARPGTDGDCRALHLRLLSKLKRLWVRLVR